MQAVHSVNEVKLRKILLIFGLIFIALFAGYFIASSQDYYKNSGDDFFILWLAPHLILEEKNPYNSVVWSSAYEEANVNWFLGSKYLYPLPLAVMLIPMGALPIETAAVIWITIGTIAILFTIYLVLSIWKNSWQYSYIIPIVIGIFLLRSVVETLRLGQLDWLILLFLAGGLFFWERQNWMLGGMIFALTVLKPQIGVPIIFFLSIWQLIRHQWSVIISECVVLFLLYFIGWLFNHSWLLDWLQYGSNKVEENICCTPTLWGFASMTCGFNLKCGLPLGIILTACLSILTILIIFRVHTLDSKYAIGFSITTALLISPYLWTYSQMILIIPILIIVETLKNKKFPYILIATFPLFIALLSSSLVYISIEIGVDTTTSLMPIIIYIILIWIFYRYYFDRDLTTSSN